MRWIQSVVVIAAVAGGAWVFLAPSKTTNVIGFRTVKIVKGNLVANVTATGTLEPEEVVDVGAQVNGPIRSFGRDPKNKDRSIDYGSEVDENTVLAHIDPVVYQARVDRAQSQMEQAKAEVEQAKADLQKAEADRVQSLSKAKLADRDLARAKGLQNSRSVSEAEYDMAVAASESAQASISVSDAMIAQARAAMLSAEKALQAADADLREASRNLEYTTIRSPVRGVILDRRVNVGQTVVASLNAPSLFLIAKDLKRLQIWASVNEADIGRIRPRQEGQPGQRADFTVDAYPGESFHGEVAQIRLNATMTQNVVTYTVVIDADNRDGKLLPYMTANVQFETGRRENALLVPNGALRWRPRPEQIVEAERETHTKRNTGNRKPAAGEPEQGVLWIEADGMVRPLAVQIGLSDGTLTEVLGADLAEGMPVVVGEQPRSTARDVNNPFAPKMFGERKRQM